MMSKGFLRGLSFGIILSILLIFIFEDTDRMKETLDEQAITSILKKNKKTVITLDEYNHLKQIQQEYEKEKNKKNEASIKETDSNDDSQVETEKPNEEQDKVVLYTVEIEQGMSISEISTKLEKVKVISSAKELDEYLKKKGWEGSIQIGTFEVSSKMTLEEIARIITKQ
jgi:hypothetical protein